MASGYNARQFTGRNKSMLRYKVAETTEVTDESLEAIINDWVSKGWTLESIQFAMRDASRRPSMAFILFTRSE
jgi:hypothetical protein